MNVFSTFIPNRNVTFHEKDLPYIDEVVESKIKDTHRGNTSSNKTQALTKSMNMANWVIAGMILSTLSLVQGETLRKCFCLALARPLEMLIFTAIIGLL